MRILVATNRLTSFTGSEIIALEVAEAFAELHPGPVLFANAVSPELVHEAVGRNLSIQSEPLPRLEDFDVVWTHHYTLPLAFSPENVRAGTRRPYIVSVHMSPYEPYEAPLPLIADLIPDTLFANSPETRDALVRNGISAQRLQVFPNPAPRRFVQRSAAPAQALTRLLVVSNHVPDELRDALELLRSQGIQVRHIGMAGTHVRIEPEHLADCDAVVTIGKTVQYALLSSVPVYCYDVFGGPGWLSAANLDRAAYYNFSGRCCSRNIDAGQIASELVSGYPAATEFAVTIGTPAVEPFRLEPYIESIIGKANAAPVWSAQQERHLRRWHPQLNRVRSAAAIIRREVQALEDGRQQLKKYDAAILHATELVKERDAVITDQAAALAHAEQLISERTEETHRLSAALQQTSKLAEDSHAEVRRHADALAEAQRLVAERDEEVRRVTAAAGRASEIAHTRQAEVSKYATALAEAQQLASSRDDEVRKLTAALEHASRIAQDSQAELKRHADALAQAQTLVTERDDEVRKLTAALEHASRIAQDSQAELKRHADALAEAQKLVSDRDTYIATITLAFEHATQLATTRQEELKRYAEALEEVQRLVRARDLEIASMRENST